MCCISSACKMSTAPDPQTQVLWWCMWQPISGLFTTFMFLLGLHCRGGSTYGPNWHRPPFWQINHANSAYFRLFLGYFWVISTTRPPLLDLGPPFYISWIRPCTVPHSKLHSSKIATILNFRTSSSNKLKIWKGILWLYKLSNYFKYILCLCRRLMNT